MEYGYSEPNGDTAVRGQTTADQLADALREQGLSAVRNYGLSASRCHIAQKNPKDKAFKLAIPVDDAEHYQIDNLMERCITLSRSCRPLAGPSSPSSRVKNPGSAC